MSECKAFKCSNEANGEGPHKRTFCSVKCVVSYDHIRMDATDARLDRIEPLGDTAQRWERL